MKPSFDFSSEELQSKSLLANKNIRLFELKNRKRIIQKSLLPLMILFVIPSITFWISFLHSLLKGTVQRKFYQLFRPLFALFTGTNEDGEKVISLMTPIIVAYSMYQFYDYLRKNGILLPPTTTRQVNIHNEPYNMYSIFCYVKFEGVSYETSIYRDFKEYDYALAYLNWKLKTEYEYYVWEFDKNINAKVANTIKEIRSNDGEIHPIKLVYCIHRTSRWK